MKKIISIVTVIALLLSSFVVFVSAQEVSATSSGFINVSFSNGYVGFCIDRYKSGAYTGDGFTPAEDTTVADNNVDNSDISQKLKVLFVTCFEDIFVADGNGGYRVDSNKESNLSFAIYHFTGEQDYLWGDNKAFVEAVNAYDGRVIPDDGYTIALDNGDYVTFHFAVLEPDSDEQQAFFAYKLDVSQEPPAHEHDYSEEWSSDENGHWHECSCGDKIDEEAHEGNTPDCVTESTCEDCGKKLADEDSGNHTGNTEIRNDEEAEEFKDGYTGDKHCTDCGELLEKGTVVPATHEHDYSEEWSSDENGHWHECSCGDKIDEEAHEGNTPDCVTESTCEDCGKKLADEDSGNHTGNTEIRNDEEAEEFKDGYTGDKHCADCGELLEKGTVVPATHVHIYPDTWEKDKNNHWHECKCGDVKDKAVHAYKRGECIDCGDVDESTGIISYEMKFVFVIENGTWADGTKEPITKYITVSGSKEPEIDVPEGMIPTMGYGNGSWQTVESGTTVTYTYICSRIENEPVDPENPDDSLVGDPDLPFYVAFGKTEGIGWYSVSTDGGKTFHTQFGNSTLQVEYGSQIIVKVNDITGDSFNFFVNGEKVEPDKNQTIVVTVTGYTLIGAVGYVDEIEKTEESVSIFEKFINMIKEFFQKLLNLFGKDD